MDAKNFFVALCDDERLNYRFAYVRDSANPQDFAEQGWIPLGAENAGLTASVIRSALALVIDAEGFRDRDRVDVPPGYRGVLPSHWMGMPLLQDDGHAVGAMVVQSYDPASTYSREDQDLFMLLANDVAVFIGRAQKLTWLEQAVGERTQALQAEVAERRRSEALQRALFEISELSVAEGDQAAHCARLHEIIDRLVPAQNFLMCTHAAGTDYFEIVYFVDQTEPGVTRQGERFPMKKSLTSLVVRSGKSWLVDQRQVAELIRAGEVGSNPRQPGLCAVAGRAVDPAGADHRRHCHAELRHPRHLLAARRGVTEFRCPACCGIVRQGARDALRKTQAKLVARNDPLSDALANLQSAQGELVRQERLASLGALVAGVVHEINTPLGVCVTAASHLEEELLPVLAERARGPLSEQGLDQFLDAAGDAVRILKSNTHRAAKLIHSFKQVSVDQASGEMRQVNLAEYLDEVLATLGPRLKNKPVSVNIACPTGLRARADPGALAQVITNLVMNSVIHAFEGKDHGVARIAVSSDGDHLRPQYSDDGNGMDAEALNKLFDPFYTTKRGSGGSELGTNIVYNLITGPLAGQVQASSVPGQGLHYAIRMPADLR